MAYLTFKRHVSGANQLHEYTIGGVRIKPDVLTLVDKDLVVRNKLDVEVLIRKQYITVIEGSGVLDDALTDTILQP